MQKRKRERKLQPVGEMSFPYEGVGPVQKFASPPSVLIFNKSVRAEPELNKKILNIAENRNSYYLNPYQDAIYNGSDDNKLDNYLMHRNLETEIVKKMGQIKNVVDDIQIDMEHNVSLFENRIQRALQLIDGVNIV